jgi:ATP/ADP translocase
MMDFLRPFLSRIISALVAGVATFALAHWQVNIPDETQHQFADSLTALLMPFFAIINSVVHKVLDKWINPGDSASKHLAVVEKRESKELKAVEAANGH